MTPSQKLAAIAALTLIPAASFADNRSGGETSNVNVTLNLAVDEPTDIWVELAVEDFNLTSASNIIVTACSDVDNPGGSIINTYIFDIALDDPDNSPGLNRGSERTIDDLYDDPAKNDPDLVHVCSTRFFPDVQPGAHSLTWLGAKTSNAMADTTVLDSSMTVVALNGSQL